MLFAVARLDDVLLAAVARASRRMLLGRNICCPPQQSNKRHATDSMNDIHAVSLNSR